MQTGTKSFTERRLCKRFLPEDGTLVAVFNALAQVVDISEAGLAFICVNWDDLAYDDCRLDILYDESEWIKDIPFKIISRKILKDRFNIANLNIQRCGLKFGNLTAGQKTRLEYLLRHHTKGEA